GGGVLGARRRPCPPLHRLRRSAAASCLRSFRSLPRAPAPALLGRRRATPAITVLPGGDGRQLRRATARAAEARLWGRDYERTSSRIDGTTRSGAASAIRPSPP